MATSPDHREITPRQPEQDASSPSRVSKGPWVFLGFLALLALLVVVLVFLPKGGGPGTSAPKLTRLSLQPLDSTDHGLTLDDLHGKVVLLNFWGTWCAPCVKEFPDIVAMEKQYQERTDFRVLAISCGTAGDDETKLARLRADTRAFLDQRLLDFRVYLDPDEATRKAVREVIDWPTAASGEPLYPVTLLLDRQHRLRFRWVGPANRQQLTDQIEKVLNE